MNSCSGATAPSVPLPEATLAPRTTVPSVTVPCTAPCECLLESAAITRWGSGGYTSCSSTPCGYEVERSTLGAAGISVPKYCFQPVPVTGSLFVESLPVRASLSLDGQLRGTTPITLDGLRPGTHTLMLTLSGYQTLTRDVAVVAGQTASLSVSLEPSPIGTNDLVAVSLSPVSGGLTAVRAEYTQRIDSPGIRILVNGVVKKECTALVCETTVGPLKAADLLQIGYRDNTLAWKEVGTLPVYTPYTPGECRCAFNESLPDADRTFSCTTSPVSGTTTCLNHSKPDGCNDPCDNCPGEYNPNQEDSDGDGWGDACDTCPGVEDGEKDTCIDCADPDHDGRATCIDPCPLVKEDVAADYDKDGIPDACDPKPTTAPPPDADGDNVPDSTDSCPQDWNPWDTDADKDGVMDACDCDDGHKGIYEEGRDCGVVTYSGHVGQGCPQQRCSPCPLPGEAIPTQFSWTDWRGHNWMTPVKNQVTCGGCWAFGSIGALEATYKIEKDMPDETLDVSEQWLISGHAGMGGSCSGGFFDFALNDLRDHGSPYENQFPFLSGSCKGFGTSCHPNCTGGVDPAWGVNSVCAQPFAQDYAIAHSSSAKWRIESWDVPSSKAEVKAALLCHGPMVVSSIQWSHVVVLVGWDDNWDDTKTPVQGAWLIKNSWGKNAGGGVTPKGLPVLPGYQYIPYTGDDRSDIVPDLQDYHSVGIVLTLNGAAVIRPPAYLKGVHAEAW